MVGTLGMSANLATRYLRTPSVPCVRISQDRPLGLLWLCEKEPVPPGRREPGVATCECVRNWYAVKYRHATDRRRVIHGGPKGRVGASVVPGEAEALKAKLTHKCNAISCLGSLRRPGMAR